MLPLFLQTLMGYPALDSGLAVGPRGIGSVLSNDHRRNVSQSHR
jgi:DHA2 family multidrug resistance protein